MTGTVKRYSEAFKLQVMQDIETGRFGSAHEASGWYGITGTNTVSVWLRRYGKEHLLRKVMRVETKDELNEVKRLQREVAELTAALAKLSVKHLVQETYFEILCDDLKVDANEFKKKHAGVASVRPGGGPGARA